MAREPTPLPRLLAPNRSAARTLAASVDEDNPALNRWLDLYLGEHPIPKVGAAALVPQLASRAPGAGRRGARRQLEGGAAAALAAAHSPHAVGAAARLAPRRTAAEAPPLLLPAAPRQDGNWSDVSGENFLRTLLTKPVEEIRWGMGAEGRRGAACMFHLVGGGDQALQRCQAVQRRLPLRRGATRAGLHHSSPSCCPFFCCSGSFSDEGGSFHTPAVS